MPDTDYDAVLVDLERQRDELTTTINTLRRLKGLAPLEGDGGLGAGTPTIIQRSPSGAQMRSDEFFGMGILNAAKKYLGMVKKPTPAPVIARELKAHGLMNASKGFPGTVYSLLYRESERPNGSIVKVGDKDWGLADWYPTRPKPAKGKDTSATEDATGEPAST